VSQRRLSVSAACACRDYLWFGTWPHRRRSRMA